MRATVGKIVYYRAHPAATVNPAIITAVWTVDRVTLTVFPPGDVPFSLAAIPLEDVAPPDGPRWQWPALTEEGGP